MERLCERDYQALFATIEELYGAQFPEQFQTTVLSAIGNLIPCDIITYNEVDPEHSRISWVSDPPELDYGEGFDQHLSEHPLITHYNRTGDQRTLKISDFLSQSKLHRLGLYNDHYKYLNVEYQMAVTLSTAMKQVIGIAANRDRHDFSERERLCLTLIRPHLVIAHRNAQTMSMMQQTVNATGTEIILVTRSGKVRYASNSAWRLVKAFFDTSESQTSLPDGLKRWVAHTTKTLFRQDDVPAPPIPLVIRKENSYLYIRFIPGGKMADQDLLLLQERQPDPTYVAPSGLSYREAEVMMLVAKGRTNEEIGVILSCSPLTVKKHLEHIYEKLGVHTRTAAVASGLVPERK
jgi:DNA-binding CsgD family transcriptional regulator